MKFVLVSIGSRGDVEPFIALADLLIARGHEVHIQLPEQFEKLVENKLVHFHSLGPELMDLLNSSLGRVVMGGKGALWQKPRAVYQLGKINQKISIDMAQLQKELIHQVKPDRVLYSSKSTYAMIWSVDHPGQAIYVSPIPYIQRTKTSAQLLFKKNYGAFINKLTYDLAEWGLNLHLMKTAKKLGITNIQKKDLKKALYENAVVYTISPQLFKSPYDWPPQRKVLGYQERDKTLNWKAPEALVRFLEKHQKILFITFGSMTNPAPEEKTQTILDVLKKLRIPAIINTSEGGLIQPKNYDESNIYFISQVPYDWLLPKIYAVMHHGGAGTTHLSIKYRCASLIMPHIVDQFVWNRIIARKGLGPLGIKVSKITEDRLSPLVQDLWNNQRYKQEAVRIGDLMRAENYEDQIIKMITE